MGRDDFSQSSQLTTLVGKPVSRYVRLPKDVTTIKRLTDSRIKPNNRLHYSLYPSIQREYEASYAQLTQLDFYSPIVNIIGDNPLSHLIGTPYVDQGVTVDEGSELSSYTSDVNENEFGSYTVTYVATDGINPDTTVTRTVKVGLPPDVTINGSNPYNLEKFAVFTDPGVTINDSNSSLISTTSTLNNLVVGTYTVNYTVANPAFTEVFSRTVRVDDTIPPVITISGDNPYTLERFAVYTDPGATVDLGTELTNTDLSNVQNTSIGTFDVVYTAYDGNNTVTATRTVNVVDTVPPVISILGDNPYTLERFDVYSDPGATVDRGSILTTDLTAVNNALVHGSSFVVTYTATDGNTLHDVTQTRTVNIVDTIPPQITLLGDNPYALQPGIPFQTVDPGYVVDLGTSVSVDYSAAVITHSSNFDVIYTASDGTNPDAVVTRRVEVADTLSPIVTITGNNPVTHERYAVYTDEGVTLDPGSSLVSTTSTVDVTTVGSYTVTYVATDGINPDTTAVRTVNVVDTTAPIVTLNGADPITLERFGVFADIDPGVTMDAYGTLASVDISQLDNTNQGSYTVTYNVVDDHNNANVITRGVTVVDTVPPVVTLNNESTFYTLERNYNWADIDPGVTVDAGSYVYDVSVDNATVGLKTVTYDVRDGTNTTTKTRVIFVQDTTPPVITITGGASVTTERFGTYVDQGATVDAGSVFTTDLSNVNTSIAHNATFDVVYNATDTGGNSNSAIRTVTVKDTTPPMITIVGGADITTERFGTYVDQGATVDAGSTLDATVLSNVDTSIAHNSTFKIVYNATDTAGNSNSAIRTVTVIDTTPPVITITGGASVTTERFGTYVDQGATVDAGSTLADTVLSNVDTSIAHNSTFKIVYNATDTAGNSSSAIRTVTVIDTTAPVITLANGDEGTSTYTVEKGSTYSDPGATADTGETVTINTSGLNMSAVGTYTVTYSATDSAGNTGTASRTVIVEDTTAPVITLVDGDEGTSTYTVERGTTYSDPGASADGGETVSVDTTNLNMSKSGTYTVTYSASDSDGNTGTASRTVIVEDTTAPVITLADGDEGTSTYTVEKGSTYSDPGASANTGETVSIDTSSLNMSAVGTYTVTYSATDSAGNIGTASRTVIVEDTTAPAITLANGDTGTSTYTVEKGSTYSDPGATANGGETVSVNTTNLNMSVPGTYTVTYSATDSYGNTGTASRTVIVQDTTAPVITLTGDSTYTVERGSTYSDPGASADGGETVSIDSSSVDMSTPGTYTVTYSATDAYGNTGTKTRTVVVQDTTPPVITLTGLSTIIVQIGTTYTDPGASSNGGETVNVDTTNLNMSVEGTYTVTYSATDAYGNTGTASRTVIVKPLWSQQAEIQPVSVEESDNFGWDVSLSSDGNTAVISAITEDSGYSDAGSIYVFVRSGTTWSQQAKLQASDRSASARLGIAVRISADGNTIIAGAPYVGSSSGTSSGATYIFTKSGTTWSQETKLEASNKGPYDYFGFSVSITSDGNIASIGAPNEDSTAQDAGSMYTFTRSGTTWSQSGTNTQALDAEQSDYYGHSIAMSPDGLVTLVGAPYEDTNGYQAGSVYPYYTPYYLSPPYADQASRLQPTDKAAGDFFGWSVALSSCVSNKVTAVIGAPFKEGDAGAAYIFYSSGAGAYWGQQAKLQASDKQAGDRFGWSVSISSDGNRVAVGSYLEDTGADNAGAVYIFVRSGTTWTEEMKIQASNKAASDFFGARVSISGDGDTVIVGANNKDTTALNAGSAYVFNRNYFT